MQDTLLPLLEQSDEEYGPTFDDSGFPGEDGILDVYESIYMTGVDLDSDTEAGGEN